MATPVGTNDLTSLSDRYLLPTLTDNVYRSNLMTFRLLARNLKKLKGGTQIEAPLIYTKFTAGGFYSGYDLLDTTPQDVVKNAAWDWKQAYVPITVDGLTLIKAEGPGAIVDHLTYKFEIASHDLVDKIGDGIWNNGAVAKSIDGIQGAVDDSTVLVTYGGLSRSANTWWRSQVDTTTTVLSYPSMQTMFGNCTEGGRHPTIIVTTQANYNRYVNLGIGGQVFPSQPAGQDEQLVSAGFTNALFNNVPLAVDSKCTTNHVYYFNEDYWELAVHTRTDMVMDEFRRPVNQDAMVAYIRWAGNLICRAPARNGKQTAVAA